MGSALYRVFPASIADNPHFAVESLFGRATVMVMQRVWLDWHKPVIPSAAAWLLQHFRQGERCDLRHLRCVLSGARGGRLLLRELVTQASLAQIRLIPPQVWTPGKLVEKTLPTTSSIASDFECILAWMHVLQQAKTEQLTPLLPRRPAHYDGTSWYELARKIHKIATELAADQVLFADVARCTEQLNMTQESARWWALQDLHNAYTSRLHACNRIDPHEYQQEQLAKLVEGRISLPENQILILIGVVDVHRIQKSIIRCYARQHESCFALIHAPEDLSQGFDELGRLQQVFWEQRTIEVSEERIIVAQKPADQAQAVIEELRKCAGQYRPEQLTIGLGDDCLSETLIQAGIWAGLKIHDPRGFAVAKSRPYRLLSAGADWLGEPTFIHLARLLRHPDVETYLGRWMRQHMKSAEQESPQEVVSEWLSVLDRYYTEHLHSHGRGPWLGREQNRQRMQMLQRAIDELFASLDSKSMALRQWIDPILDILRKIYGRMEATSTRTADARTAAVCLEIANALRGMSQAAEDLQPAFSWQTIVHLLLMQVAGLSIPEDPRTGQIEMLGWLDLHLDSAPALFIAGFNDGAIPHAVNADAFLPDHLRTRLGLVNNARRYARDAYFLQAILASREHCTLIVGRTANDGEPLLPSRLLLAGIREKLPQRIFHLCSPNQAETWIFPYGSPSPAHKSQFTIPVAKAPEKAPEAMSVTEFAMYLRCPFRYWLRYVQGLRSIDDSAIELDAMQFGTLAHKVLQDFGQEKSIADSCDVQMLINFLDASLARHIREHFGNHPLPAIRIQWAHLRERLHGFAYQQSRHVEQGWRIHHCELVMSENSRLELPEQPPMRIRGTIDRIDRNIHTGAWMIIDYKTSESNKCPEKSHRLAKSQINDNSKSLMNRGWQDLQLPLYHYLAKQQGITGKIDLAYMNLPKRSDQGGVTVANWSAADLEDAIEVACDVVRHIRAGNFTLGDSYPAHFNDEFALICQTGVFGDELEVDL